MKGLKLRMRTIQQRTIQHWIAGSATTGASTRYGPVWNPATGAQQAQVALAEPADVDAAVAAASKAWQEWREVSLISRARVMFALRDLIERHLDELSELVADELMAMGIDLRDVDQAIGTLSGGERQCVAISRAVYFGAKVLILDEPTAALGVKQSGVVLKYIIQARERGPGVIFITHNPHHAYPVGDRFLLLNRGKSIGYYEKSQITRDELTGLMVGGAELEQLSHELETAGGAAADIGRVMEEDVEELGIPHQPGGSDAAPVPTESATTSQEGPSHP